jgi:hypothetical protein
MSSDSQVSFSRTIRILPVACWLVGFKTAYLGLILAAVSLWPDYEAARLEAINARWFESRGGWSPPIGDSGLARHFLTWDAEHYTYLSQMGYAAGVRSCAFYPLWPLVVRGVAPVLGGNHVLTAVVLANVFSLTAWVLFYWLVRRRWGAPAAKWALVFLIAFPGALFFQFNYTEGLFLLLVVGLWWAMEGRRGGWAWLAATLLPLTRGIGVFAALPIGWHLVAKHTPGGLIRAASRIGWLRKTWWVSGREGFASQPGGGAPPAPAPLPVKTAGPDCSKSAMKDACPAVASWRDFSLLLAPLLGWTAYLGLMWHWTGNPFEGFEAQKYWAVHSIRNLIDVPKFVVGLFSPTEWHAFRGSVLDRAVFVLLLYCLPVLWRLDKGLLVWVYVLGVLPAMSGTFTSFTRFASCAFPLFIALGAALSAECRVSRVEVVGAFRPSSRATRPSPLRATARWGLLAVFVTLQAVLVWRFVNFRWAG